MMSCNQRNKDPRTAIKWLLDGARGGTTLRDTPVPLGLLTKKAGATVTQETLVHEVSGSTDLGFNIYSF